MSFSYKKILNQVPPNYYDWGIKSNLLQMMWHKRKWENLGNLLGNASGKLLDIGCADGTITRKIAEDKYKLKVWGVDYYKKAIDYAKSKKSIVSFVCSDARKLPFKSGTFEFVICIETLEHISDNQKVLTEIHRVLKKEGTLIVIQDTDSWFFNLIWFFWTRWKGKVWKGSHVNCMKPHQLRRFLVRGGFKILKKRTTHFGLEVSFKAKKR